MEPPACSRCLRYLDEQEVGKCADELDCERRRRREARVQELLADWRRDR